VRDLTVFILGLLAGAFVGQAAILRTLHEIAAWVLTKTQ
jgi:hypothetical protein